MMMRATKQLASRTPPGYRRTCQNLATLRVGHSRVIPPFPRGFGNLKTGRARGPGGTGIRVGPGLGGYSPLLTATTQAGGRRSGREHHHNAHHDACKCSALRLAAAATTSRTGSTRALRLSAGRAGHAQRESAPGISSEETK